MLMIAVESPGQDQIRELMAQSDAFSMALYPPEDNHLVDLGFLSAPNVTFFVARAHGRAVGCAALVSDTFGHAEIKRMIVDRAARGQGVGKKLMAALEAAARQRGLRQVRLETGPLSHGALALYRSCGFLRCGPFGEYKESPNSVFMAKALL